MAELLVLGGQGGETVPHMSKQDMVLVRRAIKGGWNVPEHIKARVVDQMGQIVEFSEEERSKIGAAKVLAIIDSIDQKTEQIASPKLHLHGVLTDGRRPEDLSDAELAERVRGIPSLPPIPEHTTEHTEALNRRATLVDGRVFAASGAGGTSGESSDFGTDQERSSVPNAGAGAGTGPVAGGSDSVQRPADSGTLHQTSGKKPNDRRKSAGPLLD